MNATAEFQGYVIDGCSRQYPGQEEAIGFFRPLHTDDLHPDHANTEIDPRWVLVEWWLTPTDPGDRVQTVGWREGDAVFVPSDATLAAYHYNPDGPTNEYGASWGLAEQPGAPVLVMPEADRKRTLAVVV